MIVVEASGWNLAVAVACRRGVKQAFGLHAELAGNLGTLSLGYGE